AELAEALDQDDVTAARLQHLRARAAVAAVRSAAADDRDAPREPLGDVRDRGPGALHQRLERPFVRRLRAAGLLGRQERLEAHAESTTATAAASSHECVIDSSICP